MSIGPNADWEPAVQDSGRQEMERRLRERGLAAAAEYAVSSERSANEWLAHNGFVPAFVFDPIPLQANKKRATPGHTLHQQDTAGTEKPRRQLQFWLLQPTTAPRNGAAAASKGPRRSHPMPESDHVNSAISAGVAQALQRLFGSGDADARFFDAVRLGTRDAVWLIAANATAPGDTERSLGHAD